MMRIIDRILELMEKNSVSAAALSRELDLKKSSFSQWKTEGREPSLSAVKKIANYFNVSLDYLVSGDNPYIWEDEEIMKEINSNMPVVIENILSSVRSGSDMQKKMIFDIFVELRHIVSIKDTSTYTSEISLSMIQEFISIGTRFIDFNNSLDILEDARLENMIKTTIEQLENALTSFQNNSNMDGEELY